MDTKEFNKFIVRIINVLRTLVFFLSSGRGTSAAEGLRACASELHTVANRIADAPVPPGDKKKA